MSVAGCSLAPLVSLVRNTDTSLFVLLLIYCFIRSPLPRVGCSGHLTLMALFVLAAACWWPGRVHLPLNVRTSTALPQWEATCAVSRAAWMHVRRRFGRGFGGCWRQEVLGRCRRAHKWSSAYTCPAYLVQLDAVVLHVHQGPLHVLCVSSASPALAGCPDTPCATRLQGTEQ